MWRRFASGYATTPDRRDARTCSEFWAGWDPALLKAVRALDTCGATAIAMPCNTAHYWYGELQEATQVPILNMIELTSDAILERHGSGICVGILATEGTVRSRLYQQSLERCGMRCVTLDTRELPSLNGVIDAVKANCPQAGTQALLRSAELLRQSGAQVLVLGCTELPVCWDRCTGTDTLRNLDVVDPTLLLARACVRWNAEGIP